MDKLRAGTGKKIVVAAGTLLLLYFSVVIIRQLAIVPRLLIGLNSQSVARYEDMIGASTWMEDGLNWGFSLLAAYGIYLCWKRLSANKGGAAAGSHRKLKLILAVIMVIPFTVYFADMLLTWVPPLEALFHLPINWIFDTVSDNGSMMFLSTLKDEPMPWSLSSVYGDSFNFRIAPFAHLIPFYMLRIYCFFYILKLAHEKKLGK